MPPISLLFGLPCSSLLLPGHLPRHPLRALQQGRHPRQDRRLDCRRQAAAAAAASVFYPLHPLLFSFIPFQAPLVFVRVPPRLLLPGWSARPRRLRRMVAIPSLTVASLLRPARPSPSLPSHAHAHALTPLPASSSSPALSSRATVPSALAVVVLAVVAAVSPVPWVAVRASRAASAAAVVAVAVAVAVVVVAAVATATGTTSAASLLPPVRLYFDHPPLSSR